MLATAPNAWHLNASRATVSLHACRETASLCRCGSTVLRRDRRGTNPDAAPPPPRRSPPPLRVQNSDRLAEQILQMEMSQSNIQTVAALQQAAAAGKANLKANDIEDVDLVLDEIAEQNDQMVQITDALAQSTIVGMDEDDLEAELNVRRPLPPGRHIRNLRLPSPASPSHSRGRGQRHCSRWIQRCSCGLRGGVSLCSQAASGAAQCLWRAARSLSSRKLERRSLCEISSSGNIPVSRKRGTASSLVHRYWRTVMIPQRCSPAPAAMPALLRLLTQPNYRER